MSTSLASCRDDHAIAGVNTRKVLGLIVTDLKGAVLRGVRCIVSTADAVKDVLVVVHCVCTSQVADLEAELAAAHVVVLLELLLPLLKAKVLEYTRPPSPEG